MYFEFDQFYVSTRRVGRKKNCINIFGCRRRIDDRLNRLNRVDSSIKKSDKKWSNQFILSANSSAKNEGFRVSLPSCLKLI